MSDTLPDTVITSTGWVDLYALTGITPGTDLIINNKSSSVIFILVRPTKPANILNDGWPLRASPSDATWVTVEDVPAGSRVWAKGPQFSRIFVQVLD